MTTDHSTTPLAHDDDRVTAVSEALAKLDVLGSSRQVADFLSEQGFKGRMSDGESCPVSRYVQHQTSHAVWINSSWWEFPDGAGGEHHLADNVEEFVRDFDEGIYQHLDSDPAPSDRPMSEVAAEIQHRQAGGA